jgi:N-acetylglucosamine-6-phosphate deacetylase
MLNTGALKIITGATLVHPDGGQSEGTLLIEGNRIRSITSDPPGALLLKEDVEVFSGQDCFLTPGLVELHFNGALGCNLNQTTIGEVQALLGKLPAYGITSALLTLITAPLTDMLSSIHTLEEVIHHKTPYQCRPLGLHLEGPFISSVYRGTHPANETRFCTPDDLTLLLSPMTKMVTIAPERDPTGEAVRTMSRRGIRVSLGHTNATLDEVKYAIECGASSVTHLFNAMRPFHHREPGIIASALADDRLYAQLICDGVHVHPEVIKMVLRAKPGNRLLVTSDASPAAGMPEGSRVSFANQIATVQKQKTINQEGVLAGSSQLISDCIRNLVRWDFADFPNAVRLATLNPSDFLGEYQIGRLEEGCMADLVLWDKNTLSVNTTFINGQVVYQRSNAAVSHS